MDGLQELNTLSNGTIPDPLWPPLSRDWGFAIATLLPSLLSGTGKATDFKFGGYIYNPSKSPLKIYEKVERGHIQRLTKYFEYPLLSQERVQLPTSNLAGTFTGPIGIKAH